ncbi:hypothetical protein D3C85_1014020 [compost metagenome]
MCQFTQIQICITTTHYIIQCQQINLKFLLVFLAQKYDLFLQLGQVILKPLTKYLLMEIHILILNISHLEIYNKFYYLKFIIYRIKFTPLKLYLQMEFHLHGMLSTLTVTGVYVI